MFDIIAFDADDTLWQNETLYRATEWRFQELLAPYHHRDHTEQVLFETEMRNLHLYGYGIKSFTLSMIETAIRLSDGQIKASEIQQIIDLAREMMDAPVKLLDHADTVIPALARTHSLMLLTKGDLRDQEAKLTRSGLAPYFAHVEILREKNSEIYAALLDRYQVAPNRFLMIGNSLRSDVLPIVALGGHAIHIPFEITWAHEQVQVPSDVVDGYVELAHLGQLPAHLDQLRATT